MDLATDLGTLDNHRRVLAAATQDLRTMREIADRLHMEAVVQRADEVLRRVESDVFQVAVVGEFKRGKSTLINALMGREVLPADVLPCSATVNRVTYGLVPSVTLVFRPKSEGEAPREEVIGIDDLPNYVTKLTPESEQRAADIQEAVVRYPVAFCRDKAEIIDTPGLNDDEAMTQVTMGVLPNVDAALLVILAQSPFSSYEANFLNRLLTNDLGRVLFVVNRLDEIRKPKDRERILQVVSDRIRKTVEGRAAELHGAGTEEYRSFLARIGTPKVYGVSGGQALDAKLEGDDALLEQSGFPAFEAALEGVLTRERGLVTLQILVDATSGAAGKVLHHVNIARGALAMKSEEFEAAHARTVTRLAELESQYQKERAAIDHTASELRRILRPRAQELPGRLRTAASEVLDSYPLTAASIGKGQVEGTVERITTALGERLAAVARNHAEQVQLEIERAVDSELKRLAGFAETLGSKLREIQVEFRLEGEGTEGSSELMEGGAATAAGFASGVLTGGLGAGLVSGAFAGYRAAGLKGAAVGSAAGLAAGTGTIVAAGMAVAIIGLPVTWPVLLPVLAVTGLTSAFASRKIVQYVFGNDATDGFRAQLKARMLEQLDAGAKERVDALISGMERQVDETFAAVRAHVEQELGVPLTDTRLNLDQLRSQLARSEAERERDTAELADLARRSEAIQARSLRLADHLIAIANH
jgi:hypothetical protein